MLNFSRKNYFLYFCGKIRWFIAYDKLQTIKLRRGFLVNDKPKKNFEKEVKQVSNGWKSRYDKEGQSNFDKLAGRQLHIQDNCWAIAKILLIVLGIYTFYILITEDLFTGIKYLFELLR